MFLGQHWPSGELETLKGDWVIPAPTHCETSSSGRWEDACCSWSKYHPWDLDGVLCVCLSIVCLSEPILKASGLLRPGLCGLRMTLLPSTDQKCNPHLVTHFGNWTALAGHEGYETQWWDAPSIVGLVVFILCTLFIR